MRAIPRLALACLLALWGAVASAQEAGEAEGAEKTEWEFEASVYGYFPPEDSDYGQPTVTADRGALHLEGRYNYEGPRVGSVWIGCNMGAGEKLRLDVTLMTGGVFGNTRGFATGYKLTLSYGSFELYSEGEYVIDMRNSDGDFFYSWSQLGYAPFDWLTVGLASQRTRLYETDLDVQRGFFVGFSYGSWSLSTFIFNAGWAAPTIVSSLAVSF